MRLQLGRHPIHERAGRQLVDDHGAVALEGGAHRIGVGVGWEVGQGHGGSPPVMATGGWASR